MRICFIIKIKLNLTLGVLLAFCAAVAAVGLALEPKSAVEPIAADSPCPATGCANGECHGFGDVPEPDGATEMTCPEVSCASAECHAWDSLTSRYHQASDASLNVWILMPVALVVGLVLVVRALSRKEEGDE